MPGLTYTLKADATGVEKGIQTAEQAVKRFKKEAEKPAGGMSGGKSGVGMRGAGGVSLQLQDVAVQIQQGTKASTIMMQQGTQLLSVFGPAGAVAGGVLGLGLLLYNSFSGGSEEAEKLRIKVDEVSEALGKATAQGSAIDIAGALKSTSKAMDELKQKAADLQDGFFSKSDQKELEANLRAQGDLYWQSIEARQQMLMLNDEDNAIIDARLRGETEVADQLERQRKLTVEINSIKALRLDRTAEKALIDTATKRSDADKEIKEKERVAKAVTELLEGIEADEDRINKRRGDKARKLEEERAQGVVREGEKQAREIDADEERKKAAEKAIRDKFEKQLTLGQRMELARERVREANQRFKAGGKGMEKAQADLAEAQGNLQDVREEQIQRIMGGSTAAQAAVVAERREKRARARAGRILQKRQDIRDADAKARGEWAKPAEMNLQGGPQKDPVEAAVKEGNTMLGKVEQQLKDLNLRLTVA